MKNNHQKTPTDKIPLAIFDTIQTIKKINLSPHITLEFAKHDFELARNFLREYDGVEATFNSYRREVERLLQWAWLVQKKSIIKLSRIDMEEYLNFCKCPPLHWIATAKVPRFIEQDGARIPNSAWRPFVVTVSKIAARQGVNPNPKEYAFSDRAFKEIFSVLGSFFNYLIIEGLTELNPVLQIRQKSRFLRKNQGAPIIRRLTELQWDYVIETAKQLADQNPQKHERTLFIMSALYGMYLRISELTSSARWEPKMNHFSKDNDDNWWFTTVGKGNKQRNITVSDSMLASLKRWRKHLSLTTLPSLDDNSPLIPKERGKGAISSTNQIRNIVQFCFDYTVNRMQTDGFEEEANNLQSATVHWLRHTGISDDVKFRPREHVRDDAGHSSSLTTDHYIDIDSRERHASGKKKLIDRDQIKV
jgi:site-specific recombinase XerD